MCPILALDRHTISSIHSGQVITSIESIVKELLENSLDAKANNIDIRLVDDGLDTVEIRDDGSGITKTDCCNMARRHHTSKLTTFSDLDNISTYGFRGEALSSICELAEEVYITTKTEQDKVATCYKLDRKGGIKSENTAGTMYRSGTMVSIHRPFVNLPVRRQVAEKARTISIKRIQELAIKYGLSHPFLRLSLHQLHSTLGQLRKQPTWVKPSTSSLLEGVRIIYDSTLASMVEECSLEESFDQQLEPDVTSSPQPIRLHCLLPSKLSDPSYIFKGDRVFIYVNKRPINYAKSDLKEMVAMVRRRYKRTLDLDDDVRKVPFMYIDVQTGFGDYDVNIEPDKSVVMLLHKDRILTLFEDLLDRIYGSFFSQNRQNEVLEK
ncbi:histidine kinase-like ATPase [Halteromyces radiatus]|uniref:histidine kinase-like ATPase n=1 Tax=Halteromyces radiatus TaxID=101107 RepID=UPI00221F2FE5|nr:histidine kinase-like ATPase [Halteromyces radiatus]KAI8093098.1 histidine kinase-like ATPase [Halteromyces radiatus]